MEYGRRESRMHTYFYIVTAWRPCFLPVMWHALLKELEGDLFEKNVSPGWSYNDLIHMWLLWLNLASHENLNHAAHRRLFYSFEAWNQWAIQQARCKSVETNANILRAVDDKRLQCHWLGDGIPPIGRYHMEMYTALIQQIKEQKLSPGELKSLEGSARKMNDFLSRARLLTEEQVQRGRHPKSNK